MRWVDWGCLGTLQFGHLGGRCKRKTLLWRSAPLTGIHPLGWSSSRRRIACAIHGELRCRALVGRSQPEIFFVTVRPLGNPWFPPRGPTMRRRVAQGCCALPGALDAGHLVPHPERPKLEPRIFFLLRSPTGTPGAGDGSPPDKWGKPPMPGTMRVPTASILPAMIQTKRVV